jgi:PAS domain S-box-containing protein
MPVSDALRALLIEGDPEDARLFREYLREGEQEVDLQWVKTLRAGLEQLGEREPDVIVVDMHLPDSDGVDTVARCTRTAQSVPVVVLTGTQELELALAAMEAGAAEYLQKNELTPSLVARTLRWAVEQRTMEKKVRLLSKAVDQSTEAVLITQAEPLDEPGPRIVYANRGFEEMTGYSVEEALGRSPRFLQGPETDRETLQALREALEAGRPWRGQAINYRKDGTPYVVAWNVAPVTGPDGTIEYWVSVQRDVTDTRRMWERLLEIQEEERRRIDQEIHDEVGGVLTTLQLKAGLARRQAAEHGAPADPLDDVVALVDELARSARTIARQVHPRVLDSFGLAEALSNLVRKIENQQDLAVDLQCALDAEDRFSDLVERTAYRVVQEALVNVIRHAETDTATVKAWADDERLRLRVVDDGVGFDIDEKDRDDNYGLTGIINRVNRLNGTVEITTAPGEGTELSGVIPLRAPSFTSQVRDPSVEGRTFDL